MSGYPRTKAAAAATGNNPHGLTRQQRRAVRDQARQQGEPLPRPETRRAARVARKKATFFARYARARSNGEKLAAAASFLASAVAELPEKLASQQAAQAVYQLKTRATKILETLR